jgi:D-beta-D-heptose 7-phosphate kinase/D-beta-D-heptose 1-phosphate adenosyltransferase
MSSLGCADLVVLFAEDPPLSLIDEIRPDILVKGADYRPGQVVGADIIRRNGGKLPLVDLLPSRGTMATIARVSEASAGQ